MHSVDPHESRRTLGLRFSLFAMFVVMTIACLLFAWSAQPRLFIVEALFQISRSQADIFGHTAQQFDAGEYAILRATQEDLITSDPVLNAALRDPKIARLPILQSQEDPVQWLRAKLEVVAVNDSELLSIRLQCPEDSVEDCRKIVDSVSAAYLNEVVYDEDHRRMVARDSLARSASNVENELQSALTKLREVTDANGADHPDTVIQKTQTDSLGKTWQEMLFRLKIMDANAAAPPRIRQISKASSRQG